MWREVSITAHVCLVLVSDVHMISGVLLVSQMFLYVWVCVRVFVRNVCMVMFMCLVSMCVCMCVFERGITDLQ